MSKVIINSYHEFAALLGKNIGVSDYVELSQERINMFADATLDHQWIHVDTERAAVDAALPVESDYRGEEPQDDGQLRYGQDEVRPGCQVRRARTPRCRPLLYREPARHCQGTDQVCHRD